MSRYDEVLKFAEGVRNRLERTFRWDRKTQRDLGDALLILQSRLMNILKKLQSSIIIDKQIFIFFEGEVRLWDSRHNFETFAKNMGIVEGIDYEFCPEGEVYVGSDTSIIPETNCLDPKRLPQFNVTFQPKEVSFGKVRLKGKITATGGGDDPVIAPVPLSNAFDVYSTWGNRASVIGAYRDHQVGLIPRVGDYFYIVPSFDGYDVSHTTEVPVVQCDFTHRDSTPGVRYWKSNPRFMFDKDKLPPGLQGPPVKMSDFILGTGEPLQLGPHFTCCVIRFLKFLVVPPRE